MLDVRNRCVRTGLYFECPESATLEIQVLSLTSDTAINLSSCLERVFLCQGVCVCKAEKNINELQ